jgi:isoamyl acetate esterase
MATTANSGHNNNNNSRPKILLLGDSLTQTSFEGWAAKLADFYQRRADVINRGYSGYNTEWYLRLPLEDDCCGEQTCLVLIFFGANDAALKEHDPHHHVTVERYAQNLGTLIDRLQRQHALVSAHANNNHHEMSILLITPPPVVHEQRLAFQIKRFKKMATGVLDRTNETTGLYAAACKRVASAANLPCLDLYHKMQQDNSDNSNNNNWERFFHDGLHFSPDGHAFVGEAIVNAINEHFPSWKVSPDPITGAWANSGTSCDGLSHGGPFHDEITSENLDTVFLEKF